MRVLGIILCDVVELLALWDKLNIALTLGIVLGSVSASGYVLC